MSFKKKDKKSLFTESLQNKRLIAKDERSLNFKVSFQYLSSAQKYSSSYKDWQKHGLLSKALETLQGYCCRPLLDQIDGDKFGVYGDFPPEEKTLYKRPVHVPEDAKWAKIHVTGPAVLIGHIYDDTFYVVFLDKTHKFFLTKKYTANRN
jgi:hypothetical protein